MAEVLIKPGHTEIRVSVANELVAMYDAKSLSIGISRNRYIVRVLRSQAVRDLEAHMVMQKVLVGNPDVFQGTWKESERAEL